MNLLLKVAIINALVLFSRQTEPETPAYKEGDYSTYRRHAIPDSDPKFEFTKLYSPSCILSGVILDGVLKDAELLNAEYGACGQYEVLVDPGVLNYNYLIDYQGKCLLKGAVSLARIVSFGPVVYAGQKLPNGYVCEPYITSGLYISTYEGDSFVAIAPAYSYAILPTRTQPAAQSVYSSCASSGIVIDGSVEINNLYQLIEPEYGQCPPYSITLLPGVRVSASGGVVEKTGTRLLSKKVPTKEDIKQLEHPVLEDIKPLSAPIGSQDTVLLNKKCITSALGFVLSNARFYTEYPTTPLVYGQCPSGFKLGSNVLLDEYPPSQDKADETWSNIYKVKYLPQSSYSPPSPPSSYQPPRPKYHAPIGYPRNRVPQQLYPEESENEYEDDSPIGVVKFLTTINEYLKRVLASWVN